MDHSETRISRFADGENDSVSEYFEALWCDYTEVTPQAERIYNLIKAYNGEVVNDHVAFRTFDQGPVQLESLQPAFERMGYRVFDEYHFPVKKLRAKAFIHEDVNQPKVFLSELLTTECSSGLQTLVAELLSRADWPSQIDENLFLRGRLWPKVTWQEYRQLLAESEYAAWLSVMGFRANHFTIYVNKLSRNDSLDEVIDLVRSLGIGLNESGGLIKGNALVGLQQAATLADTLEYEFADGDVHPVKTCYYEFALRYPTEAGDLYQGFVADSADKIFESTHQKLVGM
ncbi:MAG: DUF1338 domain-containing protein [Ketobacteraceae bacterium]|nr:DUF1338 domain-containing protein [Ketobacteraceae bacterium]